MRWAIALGGLLAAGLVRAEAPLDLDSPFLKSVIYQKKIAGYEAGAIEKKQVLAGQKKEEFYEFKKEDGSLFLVSNAELIGVLPLFPETEIPCEKPDVAKALAFLEKARATLPQQEEVSEASLQKWRSLLMTFEESDQKWVTEPGPLAPRVRIFSVSWAVGLSAAILMGLFLGVIQMLRGRRGRALLLLLLALSGGLLWGASLRLGPKPEEARGPAPPDSCKKIGRLMAGAKALPPAGETIRVQVSPDSWFNYIFQKVRFDEDGGGILHPRPRKPFFRPVPGGLMVDQALQVGPLLMPLVFWVEIPAGPGNPMNFQIRKAWIGVLPVPRGLIQPLLAPIFHSYQSLQDFLGHEGRGGWSLEPNGMLEFQVGGEAR